MSSPRSLRSGVVPLATLVIASVVSTSVGAQQERTRRSAANSPTVIAVVGKGVTKGAEPGTSARRPAAPALDWSLVKPAVKASTGKDLAPGPEKVILSAQHPFQEGKAYLNARGAMSFNAQVDGMRFMGSQAGHIGVGFKPAAAGRSYMVDFVIDPDGPKTVNCNLPDGSTRGQTLTSDGLQHVVFVVQAANTEFQWIWLELPSGPGMTDFYTAQITSMQ